MNTIIKKPFITEKASISGKEQGAYVFGVDTSATKSEIKKAIEKKYKVHVIGVRTMNQRPKTRRYGFQMGERSRLKKAIVVLKKGEKLPVLPQ